MHEWSKYRGVARSRASGLACRLCLSAAVLCCASMSVRAIDGIEPIGLSTQSLIRGGADVAVGDSALDQINNPATLTKLGKSLDMSGELLMQHSQWSNSVDSDVSRFRHIPLGHIGFSSPVNSRLTLGTAFWSKSALASDFKMRFPQGTGTSLRRRVGANLRDFGLGFNAGVKVTEKLSLGAGIRAEVSTADFASTLGTVDLDFKRGWSVGGGYQLGAMYQLTPRITLGVGYRSPTWFKDLLGQGKKSSMADDWMISLPGTIPISIGRAIIDDIVLPQRVAAGVTWQATDRLRLTTEGRWINYDNSSMNRCKFHVDGLLPIRVRFPLAYRDQLAGMIGAEYKLTEQWTIGGGYHFADNPMDHKFFLPIADSIVEHHLSVGATFRTKRWWVGGGYMVGLPNAWTRAERSAEPHFLVRKHREIEQMQHSAFVGLGINW